MPTESTPSRKEFGFSRTTCDCDYCKVYCRHLPGSLSVSDLERLCPVGQDLFAWAEQHLRAVVDKPYPTLVPLRNSDGHCHWHFGGKCAVHDVAPYGCAFFDYHMSEDEVSRRSAATTRARADDAATDGIYHRVWMHLRRKGLTTASGDRDAARQEIRTLCHRANKVTR